MILAPHRHRPGREQEDLCDFLLLCREEARRRGEATIASVTLPVRHIDPLAVLLQMRLPGEPWYFRETPAEDTAVAALDAAILGEFTGEKRFAEAGAWTDKIFGRTLAAGEPSLPLGGPRVFLAAPFADRSRITAFLPRRLVARSCGKHVAVANTLITAESDPAAEAARILAAHARFASFDYGPAKGTRQRRDGSATPPPLEDGEPDYAKKVSSLLDRIKAGEFRKVVPVRAVDWMRAGGFDSDEALERLRARNPGSHTFSFSVGDGSEWLGATPETLLRVTDGALSTDSLAGTGPRARHAADDARMEAALLSDDKIRREQEAVTEVILDRLREAGLEANAGTLRMVRLPHTRHLLTTISARLPEGVGAAQVAGLLHPTPAVAGAPRAPALQALRQTEGCDRDHFSGVSGWIDAKGDAHLQVNLRCAHITGNLARLYAGAGVIAGSDPLAEAAETTLKLRTIAEALY